MGKASLCILTYRPFPADLKQLTVEDAELKAASSGKAGQKRAVLLLAAANESIGVAEGLGAARLRLTQCIEEIFFWQKQLTQTEAAM